MDATNTIFVNSPNASLSAKHAPISTKDAKIPAVPIKNSFRLPILSIRKRERIVNKTFTTPTDTDAQIAAWLPLNPARKNMSGL